MSHLPTKWAERKDKLYITIQVSSATDVEVKFTEKSITITGKGITPKSSEPHPLNDEIPLLKEIDPSQSTFKVLGVAIQVVAAKKEEGYWNKLVNKPTSSTSNWLSVDWNLWKDEDEEEEAAAPAGFGDYGDLSSMMNMGGMGGMDMGAMGGMGGDSDDEEEDEGEEQSPAADLQDLDK